MLGRLLIFTFLIFYYVLIYLILRQKTALIKLCKNLETMNNKRKKDVSDSSDSGKSDNLPSPLKVSMHSDKSSKSKNSFKKKPNRDSDNRCSNNRELQRTETGVEQFSENEFRSEKASEETTDSEFRETNSRNGEFGSVKSIFNIEELTSDDEIYTLQCPESYIKQNLCNTSIDLTKPKQSIMHNNEMFLLEFLNCEKKFITLAVPKEESGGSLIKMPLKGHIVIQKVIETVPDKPKNCDNEVPFCVEHKIVFPDNIKVRHPLLGVEWKAHIDLANKAIRKEKKFFLKKNKTKKDKSVKIKEANFKRENSNSHIIVQKKKKRESDS